MNNRKKHIHGPKYIKCSETFFIDPITKKKHIIDYSKYRRQSLLEFQNRNKGKKRKFRICVDIETCGIDHSSIAIYKDFKLLSFQTNKGPMN